jgi:Ca-activated chloride channel homolog
MTFTDPLYLWLLLPTLIWLYFVSRGMHGIARSRRRVAIAVRTVVLLLLVLALAGLQAVRTNQGLATVFVLDRSASMTAGEERSAEYFIAKSLGALGPNDKAGLVVFGKDPVIDTDTGSLRSLGRVYADPDSSATDIAAAIRLASATMPDGSAKRIVLLSDGNETVGDAAQAAQAAAADGIQIDSVPVTVSAGPDSGEVLVDRVEAPSDVSKGQPFELRVIARATEPATGTLRIDRNGQPVDSMPVSLTSGVNVIAVSQTAEAPGFYKYRATLSDLDNDTDPRNNVGIGFVNVRGKPRILLVEGRTGSAAALQTALEPHDLDVRRTSIAGLPTTADELQSYDSIILSDYPAIGLTDSQMSMIASAVRDSGLGFGMIGGENSFLPGGYYATPIADILPVDLNVRQRKVYPSTLIEIVIDASGSMTLPEDGMEKIKVAGTAAAAMVKMMSPNDLVGVAGSTDDIAFVAPIQPAVNKDAIAAECGKLDAGGGGIYITPSLNFADVTMSPVNTKVKHLILMSDGDDAEEQEGALDKAREMVAKGITISVVAVGDGKDVGFLRTLAAVGHGYYYLALQAHQIQRLITQDTSIMTRSAIEEGAFLPKVDPSDEVMQGLDLRTMPPLYAYDLTSDRPLARTPMRTSKDDPLLAYWQYGLGTTMAFTSDAQPKWARQWMGWDGFNAFWAQAIRETVRSPGSDRLQMQVHREGGSGILDLTAVDSDGNPINGLAAKVTVIAPNGAGAPITIEQIGPGRYSGSFDASQSGAYIVTASQQTPDGSAKPAITRAGFAVAYPPEFQSNGPNNDLLSQIAQITGGAMLDRPAQSFRPSPLPGRSTRELWPDLLLAAALFFLFDVAVRRLVITPAELLRAATAAVAARTTPLKARRTRIAPQAQSIARLKNARQSAQSGRTQPVDAHAIGSEMREESLMAENQIPSDAAKPETSDGGRSESAALGTAQRLLDIKRRQGGPKAE